MRNNPTPDPAPRRTSNDHQHHQSRISYNGNGSRLFSRSRIGSSPTGISWWSVSADGTETVKTITTHPRSLVLGMTRRQCHDAQAPASGTRLVIYRDTEVVQETDYISAIRFRPSHTSGPRPADHDPARKDPRGSGGDSCNPDSTGDPGDVNTVLHHPLLALTSSSCSMPPLAALGFQCDHLKSRCLWKNLTHGNHGQRVHEEPVCAACHPHARRHGQH